MTTNSKFEFTTLKTANVANTTKISERPAFKSIFSSLKEDLLQSQELLKSREEAAANARELRVRTELEAQFPLHHKAGFEEGYAKGFEAKQTQQEKEQALLSKTMSNIEQQLASLCSKETSQKHTQLKESISLAKLIATKLIGHAGEAAFFQSIEQLLLEKLPQFTDEDVLKLSVCPALLAPLKQEMSLIKEKAHFTGKLKLHADDSMQPGDCLLEWQGGAIKKNRKTMEEMIDTICEQVSHSVS